MKTFLLCILLVATAALGHESLSQTTGWFSHGPGAVVGLAIDPSDPQVMMSGCAYSGIFKSTDGGVHWAFHGDGLPPWVPGTAVSIQTVAIDPVNPDIMFAGADDILSGGGLYKSSDGGLTWHLKDSGLVRGGIGDIAVNWADDRFVFASVGQTRQVPYSQLCRSTDRGETWVQVLNFRVWPGPVMIDPANPARVYAFDGGTFYISSDTGASWTAHGSTWSVGEARRMLRRPDGTFMGTAFERGVFAVKSESTLVRLNHGLPLGNASSAKFWEIAQDSLNVYVAAGDSGVYRSSDEGASWYKVFAYHAESVQRSPQGLFVGSELGLFKSTDQGQSWTLVSCNIGSGIIYAMAVARSLPQRVFACTSQGIFRSNDAGCSWDPLTNVGVRYVSAMAVDPANPDVVYAAAGRTYKQDAGIYKSTDGGNTWANKTPGPHTPITTIDIRPDSSNVVFMGGPGKVWRSTDRGETWELVLQRPDSNATEAIKIAPSDPRVIYVGTSANAANHEANGAWVSEDNGNSWEQRINGTPDYFFGRDVDEIAVDPHDAGKAYTWGGTESIWKTTDCGRNWFAQPPLFATMSVGYPGVTCILVDDYNPQMLLVSVYGSSSDSLAGMYQSFDGGQTWSQRHYPGVYRNAVTSIAKGSKHGVYYTYVATVGGGVFANVFAVDNVSAKALAVPPAFSLSQNFPNPFNPSTIIRFSLPARSHVNLDVFSMLGQKVAELVNGDMEAGTHEVQFNAGDLASGVYFYRLRAGSFVETKKLTSVR